MPRSTRRSAALSRGHACGNQLRASKPRNPRATTRGGYLLTSFPVAICGCCSMFRTTPAKSKYMPTGGKLRELFVHRKGATRPLGPDMTACPKHCAPLVSRCLLAAEWEQAPIFWSAKRRPRTKAFASACHGAGRALSRHAALKQWSGRKIVDDLADARHSHQESFDARCRRGGAWRL